MTRIFDENSKKFNLPENLNDIISVINDGNIMYLKLLQNKIRLFDIKRGTRRERYL